MDPREERPISARVACSWVVVSLLFIMFRSDMLRNERRAEIVWLEILRIFLFFCRGQPL